MFGRRAIAGGAAACALLWMAAGQSAPAAGQDQALPAITRLSLTHDATWGGRDVTITGHNLAGVRAVRFGSSPGIALRAISATKLLVQDPGGKVGTVDVRVVTPAGTSPVTPNDRFRFAAPT